MAKQIEVMNEVMSSVRAEKDSKRDSEPLKLARLSPTDDIESYLTTFERMIKAYSIDESCWTFKLALQLTGPVQQTYTALSPTDTECYTTVKAEILRHYNINEETYWQRFRNFHFKPGHSPTEVATALLDLAQR